MKLEDMMKRIEDIARILEKGEGSLEESIALYEEANQLIQKCGSLLDDAEQKVMLLTRGQSGIAVVPFNSEASSEEIR